MLGPCTEKLLKMKLLIKSVPITTKKANKVMLSASAKSELFRGLSFFGVSMSAYYTVKVLKIH